MEPSQKREADFKTKKLTGLFRYLKSQAWFMAPGAALLLFFGLKLLLFDLFMVNNRDMEDSYRKGDLVLVNKGWFDIERGAVILLEFPLPDSGTVAPRFIQRVAGLPGDTLLLSDKSLFVNGLLQDPLPLQKHNYFIKTKIAQLDSPFIRRYALNDGGAVSAGFDYSYALTKQQKSELEKDSLIQHIHIKTEKKNMFDATCFPGSLHCNWNADQYGNIYLPKKNDSLALDTVVLSLYEDIIARYEHNRLDVSKDSIFINGKHCKHYVVQQNYYFCMGDNRDNSVDSRHWGFLPESHIRGKVLFTIKQNR